MVWTKVWAKCINDFDDLRPQNKTNEQTSHCERIIFGRGSVQVVYFEFGYRNWFFGLSFLFLVFQTKRALHIFRFAKFLYNTSHIDFFF